MKSLTKILLLCLSAMLIISSCKKKDDEPQKFRLTVTANPTSGGTVTGGGDYKSGEDVALTATPNTDYNFVNWKNGDLVVSTDANFTYKTTSADVTLTATFALKSYTLTLNISSLEGSGNVTGGGNYLPGASVNLVATPSTGWAFENWKKGGNVISTNATYSYTTTAEDVTITASFVKTYKLTLNNPFPAGSATISGGGDYPVGTNVNITASIGPNWAFVKWINPSNSSTISTQPNFTYTTTAEDVIIALDLEFAWTLTLNSNMVNAGVLSGGGNYPVGTNINITATPNIGYTFVNWTRSGIEVSKDASFSYNTQSGNETLTANFTENSYQITLGAQSNTTIGGFYSIAQNLIYNQTDASNNQTAIDLLCFYEVANSNYITISSPGANISGIFGGSSTDPMNWATKRLTIFTPPASSISTTQFDALHQNDPAIQTYFNSTMTSGNKKAKNLVVDNIYAFKTIDNVYGLFKVTNVVQGADGSVQVILKFRK